MVLEQASEQTFAHLCVPPRLRAVACLCAIRAGTLELAMPRAGPQPVRPLQQKPQ
jgi:hypothetical protein